MKKVILKTLESRGLRLIKNQEYQEIRHASNKYDQLLSEFYFLVKKCELSSLPELLSSKLFDAYKNLLGTAPFEGLSILDALIKTKNIEGAVCEFGIAQGSTSRLIASYLLQENSDKDLVLIDSFKGLSVPTEEDELKDDVFNLGTISKYAGSMAFSSNVALEKLALIGFPQNKIQIIPGFIQDTIDSAKFPRSVSFAYVDFDLYEPIKIALDYLIKVMPKDGVIIVDDYDFFSTGAKKAVDQFLEENPNNFEFSKPTEYLGHFCILKKL
jgi:O-methyltransferase